MPSVTGQAVRESDEPTSEERSVPREGKGSPVWHDGGASTVDGIADAGSDEEEDLSEHQSMDGRSSSKGSYYDNGESEDQQSRAGRSSMEDSSMSAPSAAMALAASASNKPFIQKLYSMIETPTLRHLIVWSSSGRAFMVLDPTEFSRVVLPQFFKHSNWNSFVRQLNMYSFRKNNDVFTTAGTAEGVPASTPWEFHHPDFQQDRPDLLSRIARKSKASTPGRPLSSTSVPSVVGKARSLDDDGMSDPDAPYPKKRRSNDVPSASSSRQESQGPPLKPNDRRPSPPRLGTLLRAPSPPPQVPPPRKTQGHLVQSPLYSPSFSSAHHVPQGVTAHHPVKPAPRHSPHHHSQPLPSTGYSGNSYYGPQQHQHGHHHQKHQLQIPHGPHPIDGQCLCGDVNRQLSEQMGVIRNLSEQLYYSQQETIADRTASHHIMRLLVRAVSGDSKGSPILQDELKEAQEVLNSRLAPPPSPWTYQQPRDQGPSRQALVRDYQPQVRANSSLPMSDLRSGDSLPRLYDVLGDVPKYGTAGVRGSVSSDHRSSIATEDGLDDRSHNGYRGPTPSLRG